MRGEWTQAAEPPGTGSSGQLRLHAPASHTTRAAITAPAVRATVLLPALASTAKAAADATYAMRNATDQAALDTARARANSAADELVTAAGELLGAV
ncbi:hypothetical protein [Streptomyces sp. G7(2002)]|uniref:hypothetical protein n=1 Tax=Streptomyces sp. G7(2002) TaxID=2971798 RepID=UPI00237EC49F|nr:hypothetical protein [Streptomyces sp. G7(2002)]WDT52594.1 hypothetical protein NUT86_00225 [Streptomyces sp. G7(2002)]